LTGGIHRHKKVKREQRIEDIQRAKSIKPLGDRRTQGFTLDPSNTFLIVLKYDKLDASQCMNETDSGSNPGA